MTATFSAGSSRCGALPARSGFSLIELLVVMVVATVAVAVAAPSLGRALDVARYDASVRAIMTAARSARSSAVVSQREVVLAFDVDEKSFGVEGKAASPLAPNEISIKVTAAEAETDDARAAIRFYADGSTTGGRIELAFANRSTTIDIDWLTGVPELKD